MAILAASFTRSILRSNSLRNSASKIASKSKSTRSPFRISTQKPQSTLIFRSPVELSCCVESLMPFHTATSSALLTSMLSLSHRYGRFPQARNVTYDECLVDSSKVLCTKMDDLIVDVGGAIFLGSRALVKLLLDRILFRLII